MHILEDPPDIQRLGNKIKIEPALLSWIEKGKKLLEAYGFIWQEHSLQYIIKNVDKDGWIERLGGNSETFVDGFLPFGKFEQFGSYELFEFSFNVEIKFWKLENKWELSYRWDYPFQYRMNSLLNGFQDIKATAIDGEEYSGVLLTGREDNLPTNKLWEVLEVKLPRVKVLWEFLDERLKV